MVFEKRKIQAETLSEYLLSVRNNLRLSVAEVSQRAGISPLFLQSLESGNFRTLPADVYVLGFLRQLAGLYGVNAEELAEQYKKETTIQKQLLKPAGILSTAWGRKYFKNLVITPKSLSLFLGTAFVVLSLTYIIWQVWSINRQPGLRITDPINNAAIVGAFVEVRGTTDPSAILTVNGQNVFVDSGGNFQTQVSLSPGPKEIVIAAANRFGKTVSQTLRVLGAANASSDGPRLQLKIDFSASVILTVAVDGQPAQTLDFNAGDSKSFSAQQTIIISTSDAGATKVTLNGQNFGPMGRNHEQLKNVPFFAQSEAAQ